MTKLNHDQVEAILGRKVQDSKAALNDTEVSFSDVDNFGDTESLRSMFVDIAKYNKMLGERITFVNDALSAAIPFTRENLYVITAYTGSGKCFAKNTKILMYDGTIKKVQEVVIGDNVMGPDSKPRKVLTLASGSEEMYRVKPTKGASYDVNKSHILTLKSCAPDNTYKDMKSGDTINISIEDYLNKSEYFKHTSKGYRTGVDFKTKKINIDPYFVGYWLGNGNSENQGVHTMDDEVVEYLNDLTSKIKSEHEHFIRVHSKEENKASTYYITTGRKSGSPNRNVILNELKNLNLINNKHIPSLFKANSKSIRLKILAGLVDSYGGLNKNKTCLDFCFKNKTLAEDVVYLCRSLGFAAYIKQVEKVCTNSITKNKGIYYRISVSGDLKEIPTLIARKKFKEREQVKNVLHTGIKVESLGIGDYYGFSVDRDHLFLLDDFTVVHNSTIAANISYPLWKQSKKSLVISNEESQQDVLFRIGCLELGYNFNDYKKGLMHIDKQKEVMRQFPEIAKYVKVLDVNYKGGLTTKLEGIKNALTAVKDSDYSCAMIDYYQLIQYSVSEKGRSRYDVLNDLRIWLGQYIKDSNIPIVLFAQLHSIGKRNNKDLDSRIKECPAVIEPATVILEVVPNFEDKTSEFIIHKDRFGLSGHKITCAFDKGRFVKLTKEHKEAMLSKKLDALTKEIIDDNETPDMDDVKVEL